MKRHDTYTYLLNPTHKVTVNLIGCGGTGSQVLSALARINVALIGIGHPGLFVNVFDFDNVSESNIGRQLFSESDIGLNKATVSVARVNRFFGTNWKSTPTEFVTQRDNANITITCVDTVQSRLKIAQIITSDDYTGEPYTWPFYWLDFGNSLSTGQVILGSLKEVSKGNIEIPHLLKVYPNYHTINDENTGPSCSLAQALNRQDLFINSTIANLGCAILWRLFREGGISINGLYINLSTLSVNPIIIP